MTSPRHAHPAGPVRSIDLVADRSMCDINALQVSDRREMNFGCDRLCASWPTRRQDRGREDEIILTTTQHEPTQHDEDH